MNIIIRAPKSKVITLSVHPQIHFQMITQVLTARLLSNFTSVLQEDPIVFGGYEFKVKVTVTKNRKNIKFLVQVITQVPIARLLSNLTCVLIIIEGRPLLFFGV